MSIAHAARAAAPAPRFHHVSIYATPNTSRRVTKTTLRTGRTIEIAQVRAATELSSFVRSAVRSDASDAQYLVIDEILAAGGTLYTTTHSYRLASDWLACTTEDGIAVERMQSGYGASVWVGGNRVAGWGTTPDAAIDDVRETLSGYGVCLGKAVAA